jgi:hypothetical protein
VIDKWKSWVGLALAVIALAGAGLSGAKWLIAQEAKKQMQPVQQQVEQTNERLDEIVELNRRTEDREALIFCLDRQHQDLPPEERAKVCEQESTERWARWAKEDDRKRKDGPDG